MTHYEQLLKQVQELNYSAVREFFEHDENFLNGLVLDEHKINLYMVYAGDRIIFFLYWKQELLFHGDYFKPAPQIEWDSLEALMTLLSFLLMRTNHVEITSDQQKEFRNYDHSKLIDFCQSILCKNYELSLRQTALNYFKPCLIYDTTS